MDKAINTLWMAITGIPYKVYLNGLVLLPEVPPIKPYVESEKFNLRLSFSLQSFQYYMYINFECTPSKMNYSRSLKGFNFKWK